MSRGTGSTVADSRMALKSHALMLGQCYYVLRRRHDIGILNDIIH